MKLQKLIILLYTSLLYSFSKFFINVVFSINNTVINIYTNDSVTIYLGKKYARQFRFLAC
jgi:hypothetical protein